MRVRIQHALFAGFLGVTGLLVLLIVTLVARGLRQQLIATYESELERELALAATMVQRLPEADADSLAHTITALVQYRVTLIDTTGVVVGDSYVSAARLRGVENHRHRPEVEGALAGHVSFSERQSATVGVPLLYGARMSRFRDQPVILRIAAPLATIDETVARVRNLVAVTGLLAMALSLLVAYGLAVALARPTVVMAEQARQLAGGDFSTRVPRRAWMAELAELAVAFNRLSDELRARVFDLRRDRDEMGALIDTMAEGVVALSDDARVVRANRTAHELLGLPGDLPPFAPVGTLVRQTELRELLEESVMRPVQTREVQVAERYILVSSRRLDHGGAVTTFLDVTEIRRLEQVRRDFVANASHELKTPLTAVRGFAETLLEGDPPSKLKEEFLIAIRNNTLRMQRLVDDLLDLSRLESGGWTAGHEEVSLLASAREAWSQFVDVAEERGVTFSAEGDAVAVADRQGLEQVYRNLMENSLRHTDEGGHVHVAVTCCAEGMAEVAFSDDGEGIPSRALPRIFERFYRADSARARDAGGTGLGLAIVRHLVRAMGGQVRAESELGKGTTIRFTLPAASS
ncbi:MAG: cell wall metabolism sensor histidine kinase WalK [Gemmatimonadetes bacterium]|nr:cell wall metabolism sensor histidine kinase WalK [Gemmatimonadota bacterium]